LAEDGSLTIDRVVASDPGWIVIYADDKGETGDILSYTAVESGDNEDLSVSVEPFEATPILHAVLHLDGGTVGAFELPGPDRPVLQGTEQVQTSFEVRLGIPLPAITVADQEVDQEGLVTIDRVVTVTPGWIVLYQDEGGLPGPMLGFAPVIRGENEQVIIAINWRRATPILHAVLLEDAGLKNVFEPYESDQPVAVQGAEIADTFTIYLPPDIFVLDQPVVDDAIVVERVISYGPGWIVAYFDDEGDLGNIIGWAPLEDGINQQLQVPLIVPKNRVTPQVHLMVHDDLGVIGDFGVVTDTARIFQEIWPGPVTFDTDAGNYLITNDQLLSEDGRLSVALVVVEQNTWVVAHADEDGQPGQIIGRVSIPEGISRDVQIDIDVDLATPTIFIMLYHDAGFRFVFEFPDGSDIQLRENNDFVLAPIELLEGEEG
jgi:hypothetical protein